MARVWPNTFVEPANLTVHIAALRRALGDGRGGNRFLINIPGRGYRFVAPVNISDGLEPSASQPVVVEHAHNLPALVTRLIGREHVVNSLSALLRSDRLLTIVGPGGIGKTSVALATTEDMNANYKHGVWFIDLTPVTDSTLVPTALASALGLEIRCENPISGLIAALRDRQMLLVLDNCEHVVAAAAALVAAILRSAPDVRILATGREPLRTEGERVFRLSTLESPPAATDISAEEALRFPAILLFLERTAATLGEFSLSDADAPVVTAICQKLDGIPLAIELAAACVISFGIRGLAARLYDGLRLLTNGSRTASPRQQTMRATLDWSYGLLTEVEQTALRRLAIFSGEFTLGAAEAVLSDGTRPSNQIIKQVTELVSKSLVTADVDNFEPRLRLLQTTRAYALSKLTKSGEFDAISRRLAA